MSQINGAHLGQQLEGQHPGLAEVGHDTHRDSEEAGGMVHQPQAAILGLHTELQAEQALVLVSQGRLDTRRLH